MTLREMSWMGIHKEGSKVGSQALHYRSSYWGGVKKIIYSASFLLVGARILVIVLCVFDLPNLGIY